MNDQEYKKAVAEATTPEAKVQITIQFLRPSAREAIAQVENDLTTRNGYGRMLGILSPFPQPYKKMMIEALDLEGYPEIETIRELA